MAKYFLSIFLLLSAISLSAQNPARTGKDYAVFFYVANYQYGWERLPETKTEVDALAAELKNNYGFAVEVVPNPTKAQIEAKISEVNQRRMGPNDQLLLFFSMHGHFDQYAERGYLVPADGKSDRDADAWKSWMSYDDLSAFLARNECGHILLALDACYSGAFGDRWKGAPAALPWEDAGMDCRQRVAQALAPASRMYFSSGSREQRTPAKSKFANRCLEALARGRETGLVRINELRYYLSSIDFPQPEGGTFTKRHQPGGDFVFLHKSACGGAPPPPDQPNLIYNARQDLADWQEAQRLNTAAAYRTYLNKQSRGDFRALAEQKARNLETQDGEISAWNDAKNRNTCDAYKNFLRDYPQSAYRPLAEAGEKKVCTPEAPSAMVSIPGGTFQMGDVMGDKEQDYETVHSVTVSGFQLGAYEVTFEEYEVFCTATGKEKPSDSGWGRGRRPVINVSWEDVVAYCNWLSTQHGYQPVYTISGSTVTANWNANGYRLPTEAEWEYAAREGGKKVRFGNGKDIADPKEINFDGSASYKKPYSVVGEYRKKTVPVGSLNSPNALGLHDMSGNVWEWCWDWYGSYPTGAQNNPKGADSGASRVLRGGGWLGNPRYCRAADRSHGTPTFRDYFIGFRLARS